MTTPPDDIAAAIARLLEAEPGQYAPALASTLGIHKSVVNPVLYNDARFVRSDETKPRWYLASHADETVSLATSKSVMRSGGATTTAPTIDVVTDDDADDDVLPEVTPEMLARFVKTTPAPRKPFCLLYTSPSPRD